VQWSSSLPTSTPQHPIRAALIGRWVVDAAGRGRPRCFMSEGWLLGRERPKGTLPTVCRNGYRDGYRWVP